MTGDDLSDDTCVVCYVNPGNILDDGNLAGFGVTCGIQMIAAFLSIGLNAPATEQRHSS